jgi:hypothetical protein
MIGESSTETTARRAAVKCNADASFSLCFAALSRHGETHFLSKEISCSRNVCFQLPHFSTLSERC